MFLGYLRYCNYPNPKQFFGGRNFCVILSTLFRTIVRIFLDKLNKKKSTLKHVEFKLYFEASQHNSLNRFKWNTDKPIIDEHTIQRVECIQCILVRFHAHQPRNTHTGLKIAHKPNLGHVPERTENIQQILFNHIRWQVDYQQVKLNLFVLGWLRARILGESDTDFVRTVAWNRTI